VSGKKRIPIDGGQTFGPVQILCDSPGTFVRQQIVVNGRGDWLLPVFRCVGLNGQRWSGDADTAAVLMSRDSGASWQMRDIPDSLGAVHMNILPLGGDEMIAFYRNRFAETILSSRSSDGGETWSAPEAADLPNNNSSIQVTRLGNGHLALVFNDSSARDATGRRLSLYDEIEDDLPPVLAGDGKRTDERTAFWGAPRAPMTLAVSADGGRTWSKRNVETGDGLCMTNNSRDQTNRELSYPSVKETADGAIHMAFTFHRRAIKYVRVTEPWVKRAIRD